MAAVLATGCGAGTTPPGRSVPSPAGPPATTRAGPPPVRTTVAKRTMTFVDTRRRVHRRDGRVTVRRLLTVVRYPTVIGAPRSSVHRRPLVVFAHGFALTPGRYRTLLYAWARAGYVVAAPVLPGENANAPAGPNRADLINQPADLRFVISRLLAASARPRGPLSGLIDRSKLVVAGHSDGGDTALAVAFDPRFRSRRIDAAIILAGADLPGLKPFRFPRHAPALLAVQGGADRINPPADTRSFYRRARPPKLLLTLTGVGHDAPYMSKGPPLTTVERMTTAFLDRTTHRAPNRWRHVIRLGQRRGVSRVSARVTR